MTTDPPARSARRWLGVRERQLSPGRRTLTTSEAAALIGVSVPTIRMWADSGRVPCHRTAGGHRRFEVEELADWLRSADAPPPRAVRSAPADLQFTPCPLLARHLVRPLARALETGRLGQLDERAEAMGLRGLARGQELEVVLRDRRLAEAVMDEARDALREGTDIEAGSVDSLRAATEGITAGLVRGMKYRGPLAGPPG